MTACVFCQIVAGGSPAEDFQDHGPVVSFAPLGPQVPGHTLFVPKGHIADATDDVLLASQTFRVAAQYVQWLRQPANIITSVGAEATQSVFHLHVHVLPRGEQDGLRRSWPWVRAALDGDA